MIVDIVMTILFNRCVSLQADPFIFNIRKIQSQLSQRCSFHPSQVVFVFPPTPPFSSRTLNLLHIVLFHCIWTGHSVCASASCVKCKLSISHLASKKTYSACFLHLPRAKFNFLVFSLVFIFIST